MRFTLSCQSILFLVMLAGISSPARAGEDDASLFWSSRSILTASQTATISSEVGYRLEAIRFRAGESFEAGDILVEFDPRLPELRLESAKAVLQAADANLDSTLRMLDRDGASLLDVETARRDRAEAWARHEEARIELEACTIRAPFGGRVVAVLVNEHELVPRGKDIITIADDTRLLANFIFPEDRWGTVAVGDVLPIEIPLVNVRTTAIIARISAGLDPASHTFEAWADVPNRDGLLRSGMTARLDPTDRDQ